MNFQEIKKLVDENNITDENYTIWTDFERINMTHFRSSAQQIFNFPFFCFTTLIKRSKSSGKVQKINRSNTDDLYFTDENSFEIEAKRMFYNTVLAHGDGTIVNIRAPGQLTLGIFKNLECECVNVRINRGFYKKYIKIQVLMFMQHRMKM